MLISLYLEPMNSSLKDQYGAFFEAALIGEIDSVAQLKKVTAGTQLMHIGQYIKSMPLVLKGNLKIMREDQEGDSLLLYYLEQGETCAMTLSCCLGNQKSEIIAIAESDSELLMIPIEKMEVWTAQFKSWRDFVFTSYNHRITDLLETVDSIAFLKMDERLVKYLEEKSRISSDGIVHKTHQEIAYELHTSRVVISRLLKTLERQGRIQIERNKVKLLNL
jgi:CRP/FNR family transcriptional regulator, anaerobic regulatory protein